MSPLSKQKVGLNKKLDGRFRYLPFDLRVRSFRIVTLKISSDAHLYYYFNTHTKHSNLIKKISQVSAQVRHSCNVWELSLVSRKS